MGWVRSAAGWGVATAVAGAIVGTITEATELRWFVLTMAILGALYGLFFHYRDLADSREDFALQAAARNPASTDQAPAWIEQLKAGNRVKVGMFVALTPEGVAWTGLRKHSINWEDVDSVRTWTMSAREIRSVRMVRLKVNAKTYAIPCSKRNFDDVLATCTAMVSRSSR